MAAPAVSSPAPTRRSVLGSVFQASMVGVILSAVFLLIGLVANLIVPYDPLSIGAGRPLLAPTAGYPMGTDDLGRDVLSMVLAGTRTSLTVGLFAALISTTIGTLVGMVAGNFGGILDLVLMRIVELFQVMPLFFLALFVVSLFGTSMTNVILVIAALSWPATARVVRGEVLLLAEREFVQATRALGATELRVVLRHELPNVVSPIVVAATLQVASAILLEAGLSFLGLGDPNVPSWGLMLENARTHLRQAWWLALFPGLAISLCVIGFSLVGDAIVVLLNPVLRSKLRSARGRTEGDELSPQGDGQTRAALP